MQSISQQNEEVKTPDQQAEQSAQPVFQGEPGTEIEFIEEGDTPGTYTQQLPNLNTGLWDIEILARRDSLTFWNKTRTEIR